MKNLKFILLFYLMVIAMAYATSLRFNALEKNENLSEQYKRVVIIDN